VYYAGPAKTPDGYASGAFGPTTRADDSSSTSFRRPAESDVMVGKGKRASRCASLQEARRLLFGSIGGAAAKPREHSSRRSSVDISRARHGSGLAPSRSRISRLHHIDDKGNDFFKELNLGCP